MTAAPPDAINQDALRSLYAPWEGPTHHRVRSQTPGAPPRIVSGRRPTTIAIAQNLRRAVHEWRDAFYAGASDTTQMLLEHWFGRAHRKTDPDGGEYEFQYYFCQREALETLVYLKEVLRLDRLSQVIHEFGGADAQLASLGITDDEDAWSRYAFKLATGAGKTKVMSLAIVWSYFHQLRESDSPMARHFVVIAPNLTVYERLRQDFAPAEGGPDIFDSDPLIPSEWRADWNMSVVLQDAAGGASTGGSLYLTNIHRLFEPNKRQAKDNAMIAAAGPAVSKATALDTGKALRDRITAHPRLMVLNDEAHHVWDPDSAWNEAIRFLHETVKSRGGDGITAQLDFSATPKDNKGQLFKQIVCDTPLGEAVDAGIVKTPIIGQAGNLEEQASDDASYRFERHLRLGYGRWQKSVAEWKKSGKQPLLFVMCSNTDEADQITRRLNTDETFKDLNGKTINLHTNLKGKLKKVGKGADARTEFIESESDISDEDLKALRKLSRDLDKPTSPYSCIVSVLMLREGWDVKNVTTIVPLRPYSAKANILPEQTLGRGLRRMTPPGQVHELVTVVDHPAFASLYQQELAQEGVLLEIVDVDKVPKTTVTIFVDETRDLKALDIRLPQLAAAHRTLATIENLKLDDIRAAFKKFKPLPLGKISDTVLDYEGRHLFTGEIVERMKIDLPLLQNGFGAVSYYVKQIEIICKMPALHKTLAPLMQTFLEEILFDRKSSLTEQSLVARLGDPDVAEHVRAVFVPLVRARQTMREQRSKSADPISLSTWKPFQVTHSERNPVVQAKRTMFNLVPCRFGLEQALAQYLDRAGDCTAFAKNAGPQSLRIDYLATGQRLAFYTPDFFARCGDKHYLIETKGREDRDVPRKARAAAEWCKSASAAGTPWEYVYVPEAVLEKLTGSTIAELVRTSAPALATILEADIDEAKAPLFASVAAEAEKVKTPDFIDAAILSALPPRYRKAADQAIMLYQFYEGQKDVNYAPVFTTLLGSIDEAARGLLNRRLMNDVPSGASDQKAWFDPYLGNADRRQQDFYRLTALNLKKTLVFKSGTSPLGLLRSCLDFALNDNAKLGGIFDALRTRFKVAGARAVLEAATALNEFRNTMVAHQEAELTDAAKAKRELLAWIKGLRLLHDTP